MIQNINENSQAQSQQSQAQGATQQQQAKPTMAWDFNAGGLFGAPIAQTLGSEILVKLKDKLADIYKNARQDMEVTLLPIDNKVVTALAFSVLLVCVRSKNGNSNKPNPVAFHTLILEGTGQRLKKLVETINQNQVEIIRVTGNAFDAELQKHIVRKVKEAFPGAEHFMVDASVVPATFDIENAQHCQALALNASWACGTELQMQTPGFNDFNIATAPKDRSLIADISFKQGQVEDAVGNPVRSDIVVKFSSKKESQQRVTSVNAGDREADISTVSGYMDLAWVGRQNQFNPMNPYAAMMQQQAQQQQYGARFVISDIKSNIAYTPSMLALMIATSFCLQDDNNWIQAYLPNHSVTGTDIRDVGALNIEANLEGNKETGYGARIDTKSANFKLTELGELISSLVYPTVTISIDVPECGPQTWYLGFLAEAAAGNQDALQALRDGCDSLTNGIFSQRFGNGQFFTDAGELVHLGTWVDNGVKRDLRDIDYLAVANLMGDRNPAYIRDWSDTFFRSQYPLAQRLHARASMINSLTFDTADITGYAKRLNFSNHLMVTLVTSCIEAGLKLRVTTPLSGLDFQNQRGVANFVQTAVGQPNVRFGQQGMGFGGAVNNVGLGRW